MKNKKFFSTLSVVLLVAVLLTSLCLTTVFADNNETEILPGYDVGDVNLDGKVNVRDATAIQKHVAGIIEFTAMQLMLADTNKSGDVNVKDATLVQKFVAGLAQFGPTIGSSPDEETTPTEDDDVPITLPLIPAA